MREFTAFDPSIGRGTLDTKGVNTNEQLMLYNDSINRLRFHFPDGSVGVIPALWNKDYIMKHVAMGKLDWEVIDSLNIANNPSSIVYGEIYEAGEHVASVNASMQRSVVSSIPGGVNAQVTTLNNTNSADGTNIITIADSHGNTFTLDNNGIELLQVLVGAALVQVLKTQNVDPLLLLGAVAHTIENLGNEKIDGTLETVGALNADSNINLANAVYLQAKDHLGTLRGILDVDISDNTNARVAGATSHFQVLDQAGGLLMSTDSAGLNFISKKLFDTASHNLADWSATGLFLKGNPATNGSCQYQANGANTDWQMGALSTFTGSGTGTYNHGMTRFGVSAGPNFVAPIVQVSGSATQGYDTITSTQVHITLGAVLSFKGWCYLV